MTRPDKDQIKQAFPSVELADAGWKGPLKLQLSARIAASSKIHRPGCQECPSNMLLKLQLSACIAAASKIAPSGF